MGDGTSPASATSWPASTTSSAPSTATTPRPGTSACPAPSSTSAQDRRLCRAHQLAHQPRHRLLCRPHQAQPGRRRAARLAAVSPPCPPVLLSLLAATWMPPRPVAEAFRADSRSQPNPQAESRSAGPQCSQSGVVQHPGTCLRRPTPMCSCSTAPGCIRPWPWADGTSRRSWPLAARAGAPLSDMAVVAFARALCAELVSAAASAYSFNVADLRDRISDWIGSAWSHGRAHMSRETSPKSVEQSPAILHHCCRKPSGASF